MATDRNADPTITSLVAGLMTDAQRLVDEHLALFRTEFRADFRKVKGAAKTLFIGAALLVPGSLLLAFALVHLLAWLIPSLPLWVSYSAIGGVLTIAGAIICYVSKARFQSGEILPESSLAALKEDFQWMRTSN